MIQLTKNEHDTLVRLTADALSDFQPGEDAIAVLSRIYRENMPDKSPRQGELMAHELITWMSRFRSGYDAAQTDPHSFARHTLMQPLEQLSLEDQCRTLHNLLTGDAAQYAGPVTEESRDAMVSQVISRLSAPAELPESPDGEYDLRRRVSRQCGGDMTLAVTAMILYIMAKKGELSAAPQDLTLAQCTLCVCADDARCQLLWSEAQGYITHARVQTLQNALSFTLRTFWLAFTIPTVISAFVAGGAFAVTTGALATLASMSFLTGYAFHVFDEFVSCAGDLLTEVPLKLPQLQELPLEAVPVRSAVADTPLTLLTDGESLPEEAPDKDRDPLSF